MSGENLLIVADSEHDANMLYVVKMFLADPFIYLRLNGKCHIVMSDLEIDRARQQARHCRIISLSDCRKKILKEGGKKTGYAQVIRYLLKTRGISAVSVPENFPLGLAQELARLRVRLRVKEPFFSDRMRKNAEEVKKLSAALMMAEVGLAEGIQALKSSKVGRQRKLMYHGVPLTSEKLRGIINTAVLQAGGLALHTIVSGGAQGCDPHEAGHGVLRAGEPIILDVFPRSQKTGYYGDITRTVVKGRASEGLRKLYHTVERGQELALEGMRKKVKTAEVHNGVLEFFNREGYKTGKSDGRMQGFFHSLGHGIGLELHEAPRVGASSPDIFQSGQVVTVEPGLYYPELGGGVRLEDMAAITNNGPRNLTRFEKVLEI